MRRFVTLLATVLLVVAALWCKSADAAIHTLTDLNSTAVFLTPPDGNSQVTWSVDGVDHLFQQTFFFRVGPTGGEANINSLTITSESSGGNDFDISYSGNGFTIDVGYTLFGGTAGSNVSDLAETIRIINTSGAPLEMHFFQYVDFDLAGTAGNDYGWYSNTNAVGQGDPGSPFTITETTITPIATHREIDFFADILNSLSDGSPTTLGDEPDDFEDTGEFVGPGDITWAFQWDMVIAPGGTFIISKDKHLSAIPPQGGPLVPEPGSMIVWGLGLSMVAAGGYWRRRKVVA